MNKFKITPEIRKYIDSFSVALPITPYLIPDPKGVLFIQRINGKPRIMNHVVNLTGAYQKIGNNAFSQYKEHITFIQGLLNTEENG